jgi:phosphoglycerate dehydrogenase-like enzyme
MTTATSASAPAQKTARAIHKVLATVPYKPADLEQLRQAFAPAEFIWCAANDAGAIEAALRSVDVAVLAGDLDDRCVAAPHLKWVHCDHSGLAKSARADVFDKGLIVTGSAGRSAEALAQHGFYFALALAFEGPQLLKDQAAHVWRGIPGYTEKLGLPGKTLLVVGFGRTGAAMAALGKAFGMRVLVYSRSRVLPAAAVDEFHAAEDGAALDPLLERADVVMLAAQLTDLTYHMISTPQFARMRPGAFIVNMARGSLIDEAALLEALRSGQIAGAGLDVFATEPLPAQSPLWEAPNLMITPHATPGLPDKTQRSIDMIRDNVARYRAGAPMINEITRADLFTPRPVAAS